MLSEVLILKDGLCLFHRSYREIAIENINLTGSFIQAIFIFSKHLSGSRLESINMSDCQFYFRAKNGLIFVVRQEQDSPLFFEQIKVLIDQLSDRFHDQFPSVAKWRGGSTAEFEQFAITCDEILHNCPTRKGLPVLLKVSLKPFLTTPVDQVLPFSQENENCLFELQNHLKEYVEGEEFFDTFDRLGLEEKKVEILLKKPFVLYLPKTHHFVYIYALDQDLKNKEFTHVMCFIVEEADFFSFYQLMPLIRKKAAQLVPILTSYFSILKKNQIPNEISQQGLQLRRMLEVWGDLNHYISGLQISLLEEFYKSGVDNEMLKEDQRCIHLNDLFIRLGEDIDKVIFALLSQHQILFVGEDKNEVKEILHTLLTFYPHPSVAMWIETSSLPVDHLIMGIPPSNLRYYTKRSNVIVDLRTNQVLKGEKNEFCARLVKETQLIDQECSMYEARKFFQTKISSLFVLVRALLEASTLEKEIQKQEFQNILTNYPLANIQLIARMTKSLNLLLGKKVQKFLNS
ncbi:MAG: hypothetical protein ACFFC7_03720 [Candidatus Hermodarchaeota archaeon]